MSNIIRNYTHKNSLSKIQLTKKVYRSLIRCFPDSYVNDKGGKTDGIKNKEIEIPTNLVKINFLDLKNNQISEFLLKEGENLMQEARKAGTGIEAACEGSCACTTCHIILGKNCFKNMEKISPISEKEDDLLDSAAGLTSTSRLACQLKVDKILDGRLIKLPKFTKNFVK